MEEDEDTSSAASRGAMQPLQRRFNLRQPTPTSPSQRRTTQGLHPLLSMVLRASSVSHIHTERRLQRHICAVSMNASAATSLRGFTSTKPGGKWTKNKSLDGRDQSSSFFPSSFNRVWVRFGLALISRLTGLCESEHDTTHVQYILTSHR